MCFGNGGILCWTATWGDESFEESNSLIVLLQYLFNHTVTKYWFQANKIDTRKQLKNVSYIAD